VAVQLISFHYVEASEALLLDDLVIRPELYRSRKRNKAAKS
jgi:hypothetical protein